MHSGPMEHVWAADPYTLLYKRVPRMHGDICWCGRDGVQKEHCAANIYNRAYETHRHVAGLSYSILYDHYSLMWMMVITTYRCVARNFSLSLFASAAGLMLAGLVA